MAVSQETLTILGVGIALAGIIFTSNQQLDERIDRLDARIDRLEVRLDRVEIRLAALEKETARIGGLLEGRDIGSLSLPSRRAPGEADGARVEPSSPPATLPG